MTGKTHVLGGMAFAVGGFICMEKTNMLIPDVNEGLQLGIILPYAIWASTLPDLDQNKDSVAQISPINLVIQKIFSFTGTKHRGWQSHILPVILAFLAYIGTAFGLIFKHSNGTEITIIGLIVLGLFLGLLSHMILDMMTRQGLKFGSINLRLVPDMDLFGAGTKYELIVRRILYIIVCLEILILII